MQIEVTFYSYFKDLTGCGKTEADLPPGATLEQLLAQLHKRFPKLEKMAKSTLVAVGVEYQPRAYVLQPGDVVSLFPPVQGG